MCLPNLSALCITIFKMHTHPELANKAYYSLFHSCCVCIILFLGFLAGLSPSKLGPDIVGSESCLKWLKPWEADRLRSSIQPCFETLRLLFWHVCKPRISQISMFVLRSQGCVHVLYLRSTNLMLFLLQRHKACLHRDLQFIGWRFEVFSRKVRSLSLSQLILYCVY